MKNPSPSYWDKRAQQRMASYHRSADSTVHTVTSAYDKGLKDINTEIEKVFGKFAGDGGLSIEDATKLLSEPISRTEWNTIKAKVSQVKDPAIKRQLLNRLNAPAYAARITRLQALKANNYIQSKIIADAEIQASTAGYINTINDAYYRTMFDVQQGLGVGFEFSAMPTRTIETILKRPWSGEHYSKRVWGNTDELAKQLNEVMTGGFMSGLSTHKMTQQLQERMNVGKHAANRLVRTETTYMANAAEMESYEEAEIDQYQFIATLDSRTSPECREHDLKVYNTRDAVPNVNMPPLHAFCRSTTIAYFGADTRTNIERRARDPVTGESKLVPANMNYSAWLKSMEEEHGVDRIDIIEKQIQNKASDKKQFDRYKDLLGRDASKSFAAFQDMKYNKADEWNATKRQYNTFNTISKGNFTDEYKQKLKDTYRYFRKGGNEFTVHALNRTLGQKQSKGKVLFEKEDIRDMLKKPTNFVQPNGNSVRFEKGIAVIQASDTGEIISIVTRNKPKSDWKEV